MSDIVNVEDRLAVIKAIGNVCTFAMMDSMTHICCGEKVINEIANPHDTQYDIARASLDWADEIGIETNLISLIFQTSESRTDRDNVALRAVVTRVLKDKLIAVPSVAPGVADVVDALDQLRSALSDQDLKAAVSGLESDLKTIIDNVRSLTAYKQLHDRLHSLQLTSKRMLLNAARDMTNETNLETLRGFADSSMATSVAAGSEVAKFDDEIAKAIEKSWIRDLNTAACKLEAGTNDENIGAARIATKQISSIIDEHSPRLNQLIFAAAKTLPLMELGKALGKLGKSSALNTHLDKGSSSVRQLSRVLTSRVAAHNRLQEAEKNLSMLAEALGHQDTVVLSEFTDLWPETKLTISLLSDYKLDYGEQPFDGKLIDAVDEQLETIEAAMESPELASQFGRLSKDLERAFSTFHRKARLQFFELDRKLKVDLETLGQISRSLQGILGDIGRDI